jgi:hypothetical protein
MVHDAYRAAIKRSHPSAQIAIDKVREYGHRKIVFFRLDAPNQCTQFRIAVFDGKGDTLSKENDIIVAILD